MEILISMFGTSTNFNNSQTNLWQHLPSKVQKGTSFEFFLKISWCLQLEISLDFELEEMKSSF